MIASPKTSIVCIRSKKMKLPSPQSTLLFYPIRCQEDLLLQQGWVKLSKLLLFGTDCQKKANLNQYYRRSFGKLTK